MKQENGETERNVHWVGLDMSKKTFDAAVLESTLSAGHRRHVRPVSDYRKRSHESPFPSPHP